MNTQSQPSDNLLVESSLSSLSPRSHSGEEKGTQTHPSPWATSPRPRGDTALPVRL